jgi:hypothetical protein
MTLLYRKIKIPNFDLMVEELLTLVQPQISQKLRYWDLTLPTFYHSAPTLFKYLKTDFYKFPILFRFYNTPPYGMLGPHIDNLTTAPNKIGFNIPLSGTKNTFMNYYTTPQDNLDITHDGGFGAMPAQIIKDTSKLELVNSLEIDQPTLLRTDVIHSVDNPNETYRLILGMKFIGNTFEDVYKFDLCSERDIENLDDKL